MKRAESLLGSLDFDGEGSLLGAELLLGELDFVGEGRLCGVARGLLRQLRSFLIEEDLPALALFVLARALLAGLRGLDVEVVCARRVRERVPPSGRRSRLKVKKVEGSQESSIVDTVTLL